MTKKKYICYAATSENLFAIGLKPLTLSPIETWGVPRAGLRWGPDRSPNPLNLIRVMPAEGYIWRLIGCVALCRYDRKQHGS